MGSIWQDLRFALRQLRKSPSFTFTAVAVLALGLGANSAVFTVLSGILLRPLPYAHSDRVMVLKPEGHMPYMVISYGNMMRLRDAVGGKLAVGATFDSTPASITGPGGRIQVVQQKITAEMLPMLGVEPAIGRGFRPEENEPGKNQVVLLDDIVWRKLFNADPNVVGKTMTVKGQSYTILGVMPRGFQLGYSYGFNENKIWSPVPLTPANRTTLTGPGAVYAEPYFLRLPDGMTAGQLEAGFDKAQAAIAKEAPEGDLPDHIKVIGYQESMNHEARKPLLLLFAVSLAVWLLAILNVTSLMLARAVSRARELAVRSALGASRLRILQQSVVESLLLSGIGGVMGLLLGQTAIKLLWHRIERSLPLTSAIHFDWRVACCFAVITMITAAVIGLIPALRATRQNVQESLHGTTSTATAGQNRTREVLVVVQLALALVFLTGAGLFLRTIYNLRQVPTGFTQQNVLTGGIIMNPYAPSEEQQKPQWNNVVRAYYLPLLEKVRAIPGVQSAALSSVLPLRAEFGVTIGGDLDHKELPRSQQPIVFGRLATAGLVDALGIPMIRGRFFTDDDTTSSPVVVVVNQAYASKFLPSQDPIGHVFSMGKKGRFADSRIVGVIGDVKQHNVTDPTRPEIYFCLAQIEPQTPLYGIAIAFMQVAIRGAVPAESLRTQFDKALHEVAPEATTTDVKTIHEAVEDSFGGQLLIARLLECFAGLALLIASVGLYGLLSFAVAQRTREIGLRIALGASQENIFSLVVRRAVVLAAVGVGIGAVLSWFAAKLASGYIFGIKAHDAATFTVVIVVLIVAALIAAWLPARRATAIDPILALRSE